MTIVGSLSGVAHMTGATRRLLGRGTREEYGAHLARFLSANMFRQMDAIVAIDGLARLLTASVAKHQTADGRLDMIYVARSMLDTMRLSSGLGQPATFEERLDDIALLTDFASLLTEAIEKTAKRDGRVETIDAARFVFARVERLRA